MKKLITAITIALFTLLPLSDSFGKGFSSSSRSSFSRSSSSSSGSSSRSSFSGFGSSSKPKPSVSAPTPSKPSVIPSNSAPQKNAFDKSQAIRNITPPKPKTEYIADFKKNNAAKYPTTFTARPVSRPAYIPPTTTYKGQQRQVDYDPFTKSYGFFDSALGQFIVFDAITDIATAAFQKDQNVYIQQSSNEVAKTIPPSSPIHTAKVEKDSGWSTFTTVCFIMVLLVIIFAVCIKMFE